MQQVQQVMGEKTGLVLLLLLPCFTSRVKLYLFGYFHIKIPSSEGHGKAGGQAKLKNTQKILCFLQQRESLFYVSRVHMK